MTYLEDWQALKLYTELVEALEDLPSPETDERWEERQNIHRWLLERRKVVVDRVYQVFLDHDRKPWCDVCGGPAVLSEFFGWKHTFEGDDGFAKEWRELHEVKVHTYAAGCEAEIIKRLKFEI